MNDAIWLVVRKDGKGMHTNAYNSRKIRAYTTESIARSQAKRWNKPFEQKVPGTGCWSGGAYGCGQWVPPQYTTIEHDIYIVVKYVPEEL